MGKRSSFDRNPRDYYPTPPEAVTPLLPHLPREFSYWEPCAGDGALIDALPGRCIAATDIHPMRQDVERGDALVSDYSTQADLIITNPPWERSLLHPMIDRLSGLKPTWLLFDADWPHTRQATPFLPHLRKIVSVGRVKWIQGSKHSGKDNCCWYLFDKSSSGQVQFYGRTSNKPDKMQFSFIFV